MAPKDRPDPIFTVDPSGIETMLRVAADHYADGSLSKAVEVLKGLVKMSPSDHRPFKLLGAVLFMDGRHSAAVEAYERAVELDAEDPYTLVALAELHLIMVQLPQAVRYLDALRKLDPKLEHPASSRARYLLEKHLARFGNAT